MLRLTLLLFALAACGDRDAVDAPDAAMDLSAQSCLREPICPGTNVCDVEGAVCNDPSRPCFEPWTCLCTGGHWICGPRDMAQLPPDDLAD